MIIPFTIGEFMMYAMGGAAAAGLLLISAHILTMRQRADDDWAAFVIMSVFATLIMLGMMNMGGVFEEVDWRACHIFECPEAGS